MFDQVLDTPLCSKDINNNFYENFLSGKSDIEMNPNPIRSI